MPEALPEALNATQDFSLLALFMRADPLVKGVMIMLALASVWSWAVVVDKWFTLQARAPEQQGRVFARVRQLLQHPAIGATAQQALLAITGRPVADTAIDDGFGLHAGTPEKAGGPAPCCLRADGVTAGSLLSQAAPAGHLCVPSR